MAEKIMFDDHGQPLESGLNARRVAVRTLDEMLGICKGIIADGVVHPAEADFLRGWLRNNPEVAQVWPATVLADRMERVFADGVVSPEEAEDLRDLLQAVTGEKGELPREAVAVGERRSTDLPLSTPMPPIEYPGALFCFTGKFAYGTRNLCEAAVAARGGRCQGAPTLKTRYLVIGVLGSRDWAHTTHGRKIEFAVEARDVKGVPLDIIDEGHWARSLS